MSAHANIIRRHRHRRRPRRLRGCGAAARMGASTALVTHRFATVGAMSCNPAIGGLGKGHLVREVDALDGLMGRVADAGASSFGCSIAARVRRSAGPRAQADRKLYAAAMQAAISETANLSVIEGEADELIVVERPGHGHSPGRRPRTVRRRGRHHHRDLSARPDPSRRKELAGGPGRRGAGDGAFGFVRARRLHARAAEDRHAAAARWHAPSTGRRWKCSRATIRRSRFR